MIGTIDATDRVLRQASERLASELSNSLESGPSWTEHDWRIAMAVASMHGISALLSKSLRWKGPDLWERFLQDQAEHTTRRYERIGQLLTELDTLAKRFGVAAVALKGAALRDHGLYSGGERATSDIDLLVHPSDLEAAIAMLESFGYSLVLASRRHLVFAPAHQTRVFGFGEHVDNPIKIELHSRIYSALPVHEVDITRQVFPARPRIGLNRYPSIAALMLHLLLHAAGNIRARALRLIQLHDVALLARRMNDDDWSELIHSVPGARTCWWAFPPLCLVERYYPGAVPSAVIATSERRCPWLLKAALRRQQLTDVSWSNIRIAAFPGIEWSRTPWEALRFMKSRVLPKREELATLKYVAANDPGSPHTPWYGLSHGARIVRWIVSQPPRVQTIHAVRSALEYAAPDSRPT
jgi:predicted nucleotidyltransferase